jgi:hypothetical protein
MSMFYPVRGLMVLVAVIGVVACETARSANPVAPSSTIGSDAASVSQPPSVSVVTRIDAPIAMAPAGRLNNNNPDFIVANGAIEGEGIVSFQFEVSRTADFSQVVAVVTVPLNDAGNTMMALGSLAYGGTYFWRAKAYGGGAESDYSSTLSFSLPSGPNAAASADAAPSIPSAYWSTDQWRTFFFSLAAQKGGETVSHEGMHAMRADLVARGADFQNGWRGDVRPRLFLPVPGCPIANRPDVPACSYDRTVDLGNYGQEWRWIVR